MWWMRRFIVGRYVGEHSHSQGLLGESRVNLTLRQVGKVGRGRGERVGPGAAANRLKGIKRAGNQNGWRV